jgi:hypothetical protein
VLIKWACCAAARLDEVQRGDMGRAEKVVFLSLCRQFDQFCWGAISDNGMQFGFIAALLAEF